jgi:hypothetical protein
MLEKSVAINVEKSALPLLPPEEVGEMPPATIAILSIGGAAVVGGALYMLTHRPEE